MRAHVMKGDVIVNTIEIDDLSSMPGLVDASIGGGIGDQIISGKVIKAIPPIVSKPTDPIVALDERLKIVETQLGIGVKP